MRVAGDCHLYYGRTHCLNMNLEETELLITEELNWYLGKSVLHGCGVSPGIHILEEFLELYVTV